MGRVPSSSYQVTSRQTVGRTTKITVSMIAGTPAKPKVDNTPAGPPSMTIDVIPVPLSRAYLYMSKNSLFNDSANIGVGSDGLLTSSDTWSTQQVTAILTELAQTAGAVVHGPFMAVGHPALVTDAKTCMDKITALSPIYADFDIQKKNPPYLIYDKDNIEINLQLDIPPGVSDDQAKVEGGKYGLVAFYPVPTIATLRCSVSQRASIPLTSTKVINLYLDSNFISTTRDFLTDPHDILTFQKGFLTGHNYAAKSPAKTVVDTVTAPVRALLPSVTVTTNTSVVTGGGKPDQTTTTTSTATAPPKVP